MKRNQHSFDLIILGLLTLFSSNVASQQENSRFNDLLQLSLKDLLKSKVTVASNVETNARKQPVSISSISKQQISLSGARTLNELLTIYVPGFFLVEDQDDTIAGFRGLVPDNNSKVMLLLNGENLNTEWFWGPPDAILNGIDLSFIERIEIIRGPGSVTLGQGALLGVINIVTKNQDSQDSRLSFSSGSDGFYRTNLSINYRNERTLANLYFSNGEYLGDVLANRGWAANRSEQGLTIYQRQHHLHKSDFNNIIGNLQHKNFSANVFQFQQQRDLYNFYRDREVVEQRLDGATIRYKNKLNNNFNLTLSAKHIRDEYALFSHGGNLEVNSRLHFETTTSGFSSIINNLPGLADSQVEPGLTMGGVRETRQGIKALFNYDFSAGSRLAFGLEFNHFETGQKDRRNNNFIINEEIQRLGLSSDGSGGFIAAGDVNQNNTWVKPSEFNIKSLFFESLWHYSEKLEIFTAFRWDDHPNWGSQVTPRLGALYEINQQQLLRFTWQTGFRGAVGVQFSGGFVQDGLIAEENFDNVNAIALTQADFDFDGDPSNDSRTLNPVEPETINSIELAYSYIDQSTRFNSVLFYNQVEDILAAQAHGYVGIGFGDFIGTDQIGTWGGNWYYQNQQGELKQFGLEIEYDYQIENWLLSLSHANVQIASADSTIEGIYVINGDKPAAYPENVSRFRMKYSGESEYGDFIISANDVYYWQYQSPTGTLVDGTHMVNLGISFVPRKFPNIQASLILKNLTDTQKLYPINGTGNLTGTDGAPTIERRGWWLNLEYKF